ncbi:alpha/beta hydrolase [Lactobacillus reuteri]|uniref:Alpha/beta hydrolase n=1 Tax=Limosilactobacillus reuteri TaxID=1598 RepID=A0A7X2G3N5_LIMRT|nr:alpha/beta hydrolase [Limosilactobacillus reuteri]MRH72014.1 alpha/beta hydrolase [Limosilactobacillus reuteri]MRH79993.1 alpha/beta hydrolase [Limosilactobacillus reuteri]
MKYSVKPLTEDTRVFKVNPKIEVKEVRFQNRYSFMVAGDLYLPENFDPKKKYAAIVISGPFGAVKEQASGLYAQTLAERGFVTMAFDQSTTGESSGEIRNMASPDIFVEDFSAAVDFFGTQEYIDREKIGAIGICGLGSHVLTAASIDVRIKAVATSVMYDMAESMWSGLNNSKTEEERDKEKQYLAKIRWEDVDQDVHLGGFHELPFDENGNPVRADKLFPDELPADADPVTTEFFNYYVKRAYHPRAINSAMIWDATSPWGYYNFPLQQRIEKITAPKLIVTGEKAHSRYMAEDAYKRLTDPKELVLVPNATHTDLYDQMDKIPFDKFESFFKENLNK